MLFDLMHIDNLGVFDAFQFNTPFKTLLQNMFVHLIQAGNWTQNSLMRAIHVHKKKKRGGGNRDKQKWAI